MARQKWNWSVHNFREEDVLVARAQADQLCCPKTLKEIPTQLLRSSHPLEARLLIASFGSASGYNDQVFTLTIEHDPNTPIDLGSKPLRYGKLPLIDHIFRCDPKSPNVILSLVFMAGVIATLPALVGMVGFIDSVGKYANRCFSGSTWEVT